MKNRILVLILTAALTASGSMTAFAGDLGTEIQENQADSEDEDAVEPPGLDEESEAALNLEEDKEDVSDEVPQTITDNTGENTAQGNDESLEESSDITSVYYNAHVQSVGWQDYVPEGEAAGTEGRSKRIEAMKIRLTGKLAEEYDIYYRTHIQSYGWLGWAKNDAPTGSAGYGKRMEAFEIRLVKKGSAEAPVLSGTSFVSPTENGTITYSSHVQSYGWLDSVADGSKSGTEGQSKRMEALKLYLKNPVDADGKEIEGSVEYRAMCQSYGWLDWVKDGQEAGTVGKGKRLEAVQIRLTGEVSKQYDIYYQVHASKWGTLGWAKNGETAGTIDYYRAIESIQIKVIRKGSGGEPEQTRRASLSSENIGALKFAVSIVGDGWKSEAGNGDAAGTTGEGKTIEAFRASVDAGIEGNITDKYSGMLQYRAHLQSEGWTGNSLGGSEVGISGNGKRLEAIEIKLLGELEQYCDIYYRAHVQKYGWLGWAANGQAAGTQGIGYRMEALQVKIVPKGAAAPGSTSGYLKTERYKERYERAVDSVISGGGATLSGCYNWVVNHLSYEKLPDPMAPPEGFSREEGYTIYGVENRRGNCYCFAAAFAGAAKRLGYDAEFIEGTVKLRSGKVSRHGWVEVRIDGTTYVCDPEQDYEHHYGLYMLTYASAPLNYMR